MKKARIKTFEKFINEDSYFHNMDQIDEILDKINKSGYKSLDDSDMAILYNYSRNDEDIRNVLIEINKILKEYKDNTRKLSVLTSSDSGPNVDRIKQKSVEIYNKLYKYEKILVDLYKLKDPEKLYNYSKKHGLAIGEKKIHNDMITEYTEYNKYVNKFDFEIGKSYEYSELPEKTKIDIDVQFDDNSEYNQEDYLYVFKLLNPEETEEYLHNVFGEHNIEDAIKDPYIKILIKKIIRVGLDYPAVGSEGNHRALACYVLKKPLPYLELKLKPEAQERENDN
jgi:hypothetical protein